MNKLLSLTAAGTLLSSSALYGQIEINQNLSITGFIDMSAAYADDNGDDSTSFDLDQMEIDFIYSFDEITGQVDLDYERSNNNGDIELEQAFITYDLGGGTSMTAGKFLSYHGWETAEPTGLYQYSYAYHTTIPGYHNGVSIDHNADWGSIGLAVLDSVYDDDGFISNPADDYDLGMEAKLVLTPADGWTVYLGYGLDSANTPLDDRELINFWTSYEFGATTLAFEYNNYSDTFQDVDQWLAMYSIAVSDTGTFTLRLSDAEYDYGSTFNSMMAGGSGQLVDEDFKYTAAYIHAFTDNLALVTEISQTDRGTWRGDLTEFAVEALFTF